MSANEPERSEGGEPSGGRRRSDNRRVRSPGRWVLLGFALAVLIGLVGALSFTQTRWGRGQVLAYTLQTIGGRLNGELNVQELRGNLFTGARMYGISLRDTTGAPLALADSAYIRYRLASFLGGDIVINRLDIFDAEVDIYRLPGDTIWNYQAVLEDPTPGQTEAEQSATLIERMFLNEIHVSIRRPLEADPRLSPEAQEEQIAEILADTDRNIIEEVPGGHLITNLIDIEQSEIRELFIGPDERGGTYLEVVSGVADVRLWRDPPLEVQGVQAQLHLQEGMLQFQAPQVVLPNSRGQSVGRIDLRGDRPLYDLVIEAPAFALADLRWLYPWLPDEAEEAMGSVRLRVEDREEGLLVHAHDLVLEMPGTEVTGRFGLITAPERLRFVDVDLEAEPLRVESVERLFPEDLPVQGLVVGGAVIRGES